MRKFIILFLLNIVLVDSQEFGIRSSWSPHCNPTLKLYDKQTTYWYKTDSKALHEIEKRIKYEDRYLLLYRESVGRTVYLYAGVELLQREGNATQLLIRRLKDYVEHEDKRRNII